MGKYPVTQAQWRFVAENYPKVNIDLNSDPSRFKGDWRPVESINYLEAQEFCDRVSAATGENIYIPSEEQWVHAARGGTDPNNKFWCGDELLPSVGLVNAEQTGDVRDREANPFGLHDVHGNVWEMTSTEYVSDANT